jgi:hypothetical protein
MSKGIQDLGIGLGYVYVTEPDGVSIIYSIKNTQYNLRGSVKPLAAAASSLNANRSGYSDIVVDAISGTGNITAININGVNQIAVTINVAGKTETDVAEEIRNNINSYSVSTGAEYRAVLIGNSVKVIADESAGSSVNGHPVNVVSDDPANILITTSPIDGGALSSNIYDEVAGYRFFLDADYAAPTGPGDCGCAGEGEASESDLANAVEITDDLITQGIQQNIETENVSIVDGDIQPVRRALIGHIVVDTESSAAADDLETISPVGFSDGDIIIVRGADAGRIVTIKHGLDNIFLNGTIDFSSSDKASHIALKKENNNWYELFRTQNTFSIADGSIAEVKLATDSVSTIKLQDGSVTEVKLSDGAVSTNKIQDGSVTASKLADGAIPVSKLDAQVTTELVTIPVSFEADEQGDYKIKFPYDCEVQEAIAYVTRNIEATEDATIIMKDDTSDVMGDGIITIPASLTIGSGVSVVPVSNTTFVAGDTMTFTCGKTTPGGKALISLKIRKISGTGTGGGITYQAPSFTSFVLLGYDVLEVGDSIPAGSQVFNWTTSNSGNVQANSLDIIDVTNGNTTLASALANDGTEAVTFAAPVQKTAIGTHQFKITGQNTQGGTFERTDNVNWQFRVFFGNDANAGPLNETQVEALANNPLQSGFSGEYFFPGGNYKYLAFPVSWGTPSTFTDKVTSLSVPMEASYLVNLTNAFGVSEDYNIYRTTNILGGDVTIVVA